jgi:hypothetical protein
MKTTTFAPDRQAFREMLATLAAKTLTKIPALNGRVEKAVKLALAGDVELHDDGTATVYSSSDPTRRYEIRQGTCTCRDYEQAPEKLCQHRLSAGLVRKAHELLPPALTPDVGTSPDTTPLPEAPCSANCHIMLEGRQVQLTLRDTDEARLLQRLQTVLQQYSVPQAPPQASSQGQGEGWCAVHNVALHVNHGKDGRTWLSHKTADGWCKGR